MGFLFLHYPFVSAQGNIYNHSKNKPSETTAQSTKVEEYSNRKENSGAFVPFCFQEKTHFTNPFRLLHQWIVVIQLQWFTADHLHHLPHILFTVCFPCYTPMIVLCITAGVVRGYN